MKEEGDWSPQNEKDSKNMKGLEESIENDDVDVLIHALPDD